MVSIKVRVSGTSVVAEFPQKLTSGMVGVPVEIEYDESWNGLYKTASFRFGDFVRSRENIGTSTTVPWEVMRNHGKSLEVGIEGRDENGDIVIPTVWATVGTIQQGAVSSVAATPNPGLGGMVQPGAVIDDSQISAQTTWSSQKISDEIGIDSAVLYTLQNLTEEQKAQARENIYAAKIPTDTVIEPGEMLCTVSQSNLTEKNGMFVYEYGATPDWLTESKLLYISGSVHVGEKEEFLMFGFSDLRNLQQNEYGVYQYSLDNCYDEDGEPLVVLSVGIGIDPVTGGSNGGKLVFASKTKNVRINVRKPERKFTELHPVVSVSGKYADLNGNISVPKYSVLYGSRQGLVSSQKEVARNNIGAADASDVVLHTVQTLTEKQKEQARENIGAAFGKEKLVVIPERRNEVDFYAVGVEYGKMYLQQYDKETGKVTGAKDKFLTSSDMPGIIEDVIAALPIYSGEVEEV